MTSLSLLAGRTVQILYEKLVQIYDRAKRQYVKNMSLCFKNSNVFSYRNPNGPNSIPASWPKYDMMSQQYLDISSQITEESVKQRIAARRMEFWLNLLPELLKSQ